MAIRQNKSGDATGGTPSGDNAKVGGGREERDKIGGKGDFGIPADQAIDRALRQDDEYAARPAGSRMTGRGDTARQHGVGAQGGGVGKGSGGDVDTDLIGVGTPGGGSVTGDTEYTPGPDDADNGTTNPSTSGRRYDEHYPAQVGGDHRVKGGDTLDHGGGDASTSGGSQGASSVQGSQEDQLDNAAAGEISQGEAQGDDNSDSDNAH